MMDATTAAILPPGLPSSLLALATCQSEALRERKRGSGGLVAPPLSLSLSSSLPPSFIPSFLERARGGEKETELSLLLPPSIMQRERQEARWTAGGAKEMWRRAERGGEGRGAKANTVGGAERTDAVVTDEARPRLPNLYLLQCKKAKRKSRGRERGSVRPCRRRGRRGCRPHHGPGR